MKKLLLLLLCLVFSGGTPVVIEDIHPIDESFGECMDHSEAITSKMVDCMQEAYVHWKAELNKYYNLLMDVLYKDAKKRLVKSQSTWKEYWDEEFEFTPTYFKDMGSRIGSAKCNDKVNTIKHRALELRSYYKTVVAE